MEQLIQDVCKRFPKFSVLPFEELELIMPEAEEQMFKKKYAGTFAVVGFDVIRNKKRYKLHSFIQSKGAFSMGFADGTDLDSRKCRGCKKEVEYEGEYFDWKHRTIWRCHTTMCFGQHGWYQPRIRNVVLFALHDFRPHKAIARQRKQIKYRLPEILLQIHSEGTTYLSWLPKDLIQFLY